LALASEQDDMSGLADGRIERIVAVGADHPRFEVLKAGDLKSCSSGSVQLVYCSGIEAWAVVEFRRVLSAIIRILEPGGVIRIAAQDLDVLIHGYLLEWRNGQPTDVTRAQRLNDWRKTEKAQYIFNEEDLRAELENAGFVDIWRLPAGASSIEVFRDCEQREAMGLILEGRSPVLAE
jgi:predicted SAM-dependent methyltransferase